MHQKLKMVIKLSQSLGRSQDLLNHLLVKNVCRWL